MRCYNMGMDFKRVKVITTVPAKEADKLREALAKAGTGNMGDYRECSFSILGKGRFRPTEDADPHIGKPNKLEVVEEEQINVMCKREYAKQVVQALRKAHPYEEPLIEVIPLIDEADL